MIKADITRAEGITKLQNAYEWAIDEAPQHKNKVKLAETAGNKVNVTASGCHVP